MIWLLMFITNCFASTDFFLPETANVKKWSYTESYNIRDGIRDTNGYLEIIFEPSKYKHVLYRIKIDGLIWNNKFNKIYYNGFKCGEKKWFGFKNYCELKAVKMPDGTMFSYGTK